MNSVTCPKCAQEFESPTESVGKETRCSRCGHSFALPSPSQADADLVLYPIGEPTPIRFSPIKMAARIVLVFLVLGGLVMIAGLVDSFMR
jgi:hypothetical protein